MNDSKPFDTTTPLPHKDAFFPLKGVYLNAGVQHPISRASVNEACKYLTYKGFHTDIDIDPLTVRKEVLVKFASLINARCEDLTFVGSTTVGENLILQALELNIKGGEVITDDLHYFGSYQMYGELKKLGVNVITIRSKNGTIDYKDYEAAVTDETTLIVISGVSTFNGHQHDVKRVCDIAHAKGALVYVDGIHQIGATPFDVQDSGVDFACCGAFKWLMADQGLGFLYVRPDRFDRIKRPWFGKRQVRNLVTHVFPGDDITNDQNIYEYELEESTEGYFAVWSEPRIVIAQLRASLQYILDVTVERICQYRQPMLHYIRKEIEAIGFKCLSPADSITPILAFECRDANKRLGPLFEDANIKASLYKGHFRVAVSVYNDIDDAIKLVETLKRLG
tara:strand:- start:228332 stop:229513 length:1182 start_codon:yes stop_codon:yes gene_type:complete